MKRIPLKLTLAGSLVATALVLSVVAAAQAAPAVKPTPATKAAHETPVAGHSKESAAGAEHSAAMMAECKAMMERKQKMQDKMVAMDATLDKLVAEMNAAKGSTSPDAMEKPMAAVLTELVAQRKASHAMAMDMEPAMAAHMAHHMAMHGGKGGMECPMMKDGMAHAPAVEEMKPKT